MLRTPCCSKVSSYLDGSPPIQYSDISCSDGKIFVAADPSRLLPDPVGLHVVHDDKSLESSMLFQIVFIGIALFNTPFHPFFVSRVYDGPSMVVGIVMLVDLPLCLRGYRQSRCRSKRNICMLNPFTL